MYIAVLVESVNYKIYLHFKLWALYLRSGKCQNVNIEYNMCHISVPEITGKLKIYIICSSDKHYYQEWVMREEPWIFACITVVEWLTSGIPM